MLYTYDASHLTGNRTVHAWALQQDNHAPDSNNTYAEPYPDEMGMGGAIFSRGSEGYAPLNST